MRTGLTKRELAAVGQGSLLRTGPEGLANAVANLPYLRKTIIDLQRELPAPADPSAIVVSAGPSLYRRESAKAILDSGYRGTIIAADAALGYCLRSGLVPHYVVSVDPHPWYVLRWYGDPDLASREPDDYFRRQELDPTLHADEVAKNDAQIALVNQYGGRLKTVLATSVSEGVTRRCLQAGMDVYWWNPLYDDWDAPDSYTRRVYELNRVPCMVGGGNVGTSGWVFAHSILSHKHVAMVGMDFSYPPGTPFYNTQWYHKMREFFGDDRIHEGYIEIENPSGERWFTDPTYEWYRQGFLELVEAADCVTYNCTEGGIIFGGSIRWTPLKEFLGAWSR